MSITSTTTGKPATGDIRTSVPAGSLGTFGGVFTPSILTILGLVLFLRLGYVTGNVGFVQMLLILGLATMVSILTTISLAAIATNLRVGGGGVYFLISRTLGPAFGGAIGLVLYLAMSISIAFYAIGLGEAVTAVIGSTNDNLPRLIAAGTIVALLGLAWLGADIATRLQYVVMVLLVVAILGYFAGVIPDLSVARFGRNLAAPASGDGFWVGFAIFFPAITGFTQGVAMSGDLRTPSRSITFGTFTAIGVSTVIYAAVILTFAMAVPLTQLRAETTIMRQLAVAPLLIDLGVIAATLSSAIASILGAPRTLQRLAADRLIKPLEPFGAGSGASNNPRRAVLLSTAIALATVAVGDLELVAPIISMFFLASYGMINYATYSEARAASTSFRPTFRWFHRRLSLAGTLACLAVILAINPIAGGAAGIAVFGLYRYLGRSVQQTRWADSTRGFHAAEVRSHLQQLTSEGEGRDWRPFTLAFAPRDPVRRQRLIDTVDWLEGGAGFTTVVRIIAGRGPIARKHAHAINLQLQHELDRSTARPYGRVLVAPDLETGASAMLQAHGIGALRPNLAAFSWFDPTHQDRPNTPGYQAMMQTAVRFGTNVAVVHTPDEAWDRLPSGVGSLRRIVIWWHEEKTGQLLTFLAWMCTRHPRWAGAELQIWIAGTATDPHDHVRGLVTEARIPATLKGSAELSEFVAIAAAADLTFAPLRVRDKLCLGPGDILLDELINDQSNVVFAQAATEVQLDVQPDDSYEATLAEAHDRATQTSKRAADLDAEAGRLIVAAETLRMERALDPADAELGGRLDEAAAAASAAQRRYVDARSRADEAWRLVREIDPLAVPDSIQEDLWLPTGETRTSEFR